MPSPFVLELSPATFSVMKLPHHAARSIIWSDGFSPRLCQPSTLRMVIWPEASKAQNNIAAVSAPFDERRRQEGLGLDPSFELFVQSLMVIRFPAD